MVKFVALLDPPSTHSFGMVPFIVNGDDLDGPMVVGLTGGNTTLSLGYHLTLEAFIAAGHARVIPDQSITFKTMPSDLVVGWLGGEFRKECRRLGLPLPDVASVTYGAPDGFFWIEPPALCYPRLEKWTLAAAPRAIKERSMDIARLMGWCLPKHEATCAALWHADASKGREQGLRHALIGLDGDRKGRSAKRAMRKRLKTIVDRYLQTA